MKIFPNKKSKIAKKQRGPRPVIDSCDRIKFSNGKPVEPEYSVPVSALNAALRKIGLWDRYKAMNTMSKMDKYILLFGSKELKDAVLLIHKWKVNTFREKMSDVAHGIHNKNRSKLNSNITDWSD